ncbi:MAG: hypothetical protein JO296_01685 [Pseudonocardiales bacterium]|nr:hypothetical protein [Pseudonocardiales bacterium]MBV9648835.1 hypothetical protein [Pseudonocardiales bacterium]
MEKLWADIEQARGARAAVGEVPAIAAMRELTEALPAIAFETVCNAPE